MKVTYTGKTVRNNKERTVTYTGGVGTPSVKNGVTATYIGGKQSKAVYDAEAKTREALRNAAETKQSTGRDVGDISALGAGNYGADKRIFDDGYNVGQGLAKAGQIGLTQIAKAGSSAGAWLENQLGNFAREGTNGYWDPDTSKWLFNRWNQAIDAEAHGVQQRYAENTQRGGRAAEVFEDMGAATVAAIPQAVAAVLTGGASAAAQSGALAERAAATPGLVGTISRGMRAMAKDPNFQLSFVQVFGPGYEQAKADGADDLRASLYAVGNGLMNAAVEVGGGIQTLPKELQTGGNAWKSWVDSMLDEGKEEVVQGVIERAMQNTVYGRDNPYIGVGNGAIFDPAAAAEEFAGGAVVGGLLGGGQIGLNTLANRAAYNAAKAQYDRDVRQNTAPEMDSKAAQAVDAVTRGESITGNQAAAIAKNPVAVETLEANTGVKLNTQQPISQLKRDIAALASRDTTQKQPQGTTATPVTHRRAQKPTGGFLEAGQKVYQEMSRTAEDVPTLYAGFSSVYNAGLNGIEASKAKGAYAAMLTPEQRYAAYNAGLEDAAAQVARENAEVKSVTTTAGAGLADNVYSRAVIAKSKRTAATLNAMGKKLGVRIEFVDSVMGGQANGQYIRDKNLIQIAVDSNKPYLNVAAHEVTHRMQDLSPAEYRKFRQAAMEHRMREKGIDEMAEVVEWYREKAESSGVTLTQDEVMDEIAADFAGNMMENPDLFREFSQSNRTAAQKLLDSLKEFIAKVKSIFTGKARDVAAQEAYGKDFAELEAVAQKWQEAFDAAERQAERATVSATVRSGDTVQYDDAVYSLRVTDKDTLDFLDKQKTITTYKTMQLVDGKLYPPMAARVDGKYEDASELGAWEMSVERPDLVKDGKFKLDKGKGQGSLTAAYNPYMHSSNLVINDQFSGAYTRDNLVTVECEVPVSEMTSGYHADGAKDSVGWHSWHTGTVAGQVRRATGVERKVFLSRWIKPVRILPDAEVAHMYKKLLGDTGIEVPDNVVTPGLLAELKKVGVPIKESGRVKTAAGEGERKYVDTNAARSVGVSVDANTESASPAQYSLKTWSESDYVTQRKKAAEELSVALNVSIRTATKYIDNINSVAKMIADDRVRLDYEASPGRSSFVSNSEYGGSLDFSTICKKRRLLTGTLEAIQRALPNTALTADEILSIRRMMADKGYEVSCGLCYVEGSRAKMGVYTKEFLEEYAKSGAEYVPNMAEMNTATGQERIRSEHPEVYEAYEKYMNKLAQRKPKLYQLATEYQGEIRKKFKGKGSVEEKNKNGGMRLQSFSDFEIIHLIDCMQAIMDMSEVGLAGQAYTKVPDFAWALGDTGLKINLSLIAKGVDANGNIILDETEGMTRSDAEALRKRYPKNVGTILVVFNDAQLRAAMKNDFIDFIIPFHRSQWNSAQYEALGLPQGAKDYTPWQNESYIEPVYNKTGKKQRPENYMPNEYWDYGRSGKENAEKYLRMCAENNRKPKFSFLLDKGADGAYHLKADGSTDGYWKLLIDFKMYDNVGNGSPQMPVSPKFNMEECERMLRDYTGGHAAFPVANDVVDQFVEAYKESNPGVRFSLKKPVEETKNLLALHNLTEKNLLDAAKLGGLPMPSIAIVKADEGHGEYGDISFVFSKDTIDPQLFRSNKVYGYDAWTPTAPRIEYEVNEKSAKKIHDLFYRMERSKGRSFADPLYSAANTLEDELNRKGGVDKVVGAMRDDPRMMNIYLEDTGRGAVENVMKREVTRMDDNQQEMASFLIRELGESTVNDFRAKGGESPIAARKLWYKEHGEALNAALQKYYEKLGLPAKDAADVVNAETVAAKMRYMLDARKYLAGNTETVTEEVDRDATNKAIRDKVNKAEYDQWLDNLFDGVVKNEGIYNGKDYYTSAGNRRSFSATHYEITLENIVKAMKQGDQKGANTFFGGQAIWGVASKDYGSIDEIKADSGRLQKMPEEEYSAIRQKYSERLAELANEIKDPAARNEFIASDDAASAIVETLRTKRTVAAIDKELRTYPTLQIKPDTAEKVLQLYKDISNMPTGYFEAKPQRAVGFDEVLAAVIPNDASAEVKAALENAGVRMIEYASGDEKSRLDAVNSVEGARFQLRSTADIEQEMRDLKRERTALASRNRALEQRVQDLKGEMRISKEPSVVLRDVKRLGLDTIRRYDSDVKYADIQTDMEALGKAVMKKDVSMSDMMPYAKRVAEKIVDNTAELTENGAELLEIRDYLKRQKILFNGEMDHYNEFRKQHIGTMKLNKTEGTPVDTIYAEMTEMFGEGYFPSDVYTEADKLYRIADVLDGMDAIYQNPFAGYRDAAVQEIANDIIDGMISGQVRQKKTYADRVALEKQEAVGRVREMLYKEREKRKGQIKQLRKEYNEKTQKGREKRYATEMRARIARHTGSISEKLLRPTDKKHIPEELRVVVADLLRNINLESAYSYDENGRLRKNAGGDPTRRTQEAVKLKKAYEDIIAREGNMVVDPDLLDSGGLLDSLAALGGKRIADMNVAELETVWNAVRSIEATLTSYDRTLANQKYARTSEWADSLMMGSMSRKRRNRKISLDMADPYTFFSAYGDGGMQIYRTLRNAQDREHVMLTELREAAKKFLDADVYKNRFERHTFTTSRGVDLTLTNEQIMNLYNLAKRGEQSMNHLMVGGIVQPEIKRYGKLKAIPRGTENILLTLEDVRAITSVLTPEQIKVADGLQKLASTKLAEWGNEASMTVYGYRKFMEAHYWPIKTAKEATASSVEKGPDIAREIKNMGSAKALTPNASNALDIGGVYDVFAQNASDMIKYATLLAPMEDINRLYNYRYRDSMGNLTGKNVRQVLSGVYGEAAQSYWRNLMRDVQNGMVKNASATTRAVERIVGNTKGAAVGANLRVVIQQPTAYFRAAVALDPEYMVKGVKKGVTAGNGWDKARRWAPIAGIKDTSGFDQGSRYTIAREVYGTDGGVLEWLNDKSMALAGKADAVTWGKIWNACEWQVASETNLEVGSDAYYRQVAAVFTDVIDQTQVVDGIMQRAQIMRDSDALTRQATSFMGEPLKSLNMFMRAYDAWAYENNPQKRSSALKKLKRSVAALVVTDTVNALAQSIVDGLRDDDKDKNWAERILEAFTGYSGDEENAGEAVKNVVLGGNLISNMNPAGRIPYVKDILSILQGYTVDRMDAAAADDIIRTAKTFIKGLNGDAKTTTAYNLKQVMLMCSKVFGISIGNMGRDMWSIARSIASDTGNVRLMFEMEKAIYRMDKSAGNRKRWCELLYRAQKDNDTETARLIYKEMLEHGYEETDVRQGVEAIMKAEQKVKSVDDLKNRWRAP